MRYDSLIEKLLKGKEFQSTYLCEVRLPHFITTAPITNFNPRTSVRYDSWSQFGALLSALFQSTYLCEVRLPYSHSISHSIQNFNPRTSVRYDGHLHIPGISCLNFNPRTSVRYDHRTLRDTSVFVNFNPRTSVRYDTPVF